MLNISSRFTIFFSGNVPFFPGCERHSSHPTIKEIIQTLGMLREVLEEEPERLILSKEGFRAGIALNVLDSHCIVSMNDQRQVIIQKLFWRFITGQYYKATQICAIKT